MSLDSSVIDLCAKLFDWAKFQRTKGAVKLHLLLDHDGYLPSVIVITDGRCHDVRVARELKFNAGTIIVMDRGYVDFAWFGRLTAQGVFFVTRMKDGTRYEVVEKRHVSDKGYVVRDDVVRLTGPRAQKDCSHLLRRIEYVTEETAETFVFLTNHLSFPQFGGHPMKGG